MDSLPPKHNSLCVLYIRLLLCCKFSLIPFENEEEPLSFLFYNSKEQCGEASSRAFVVCLKQRKKNQKSKSKIKPKAGGEGTEGGGF